MRAALLFVVGTLMLGCQPPPVWRHSPYTVINGDPHVEREVLRSTEDWQAARAWVANARTELPQKPYVERIRLSVTDPRTNKPVTVRGAVAVSPGHAVRLLLVGPGGGTALDAWVTPDRYRVEIPAIHLTRRGGRELSSDPRATLGLPVGFLRWWFLAPLGGTLIDAENIRSDDQVIGTTFRFRTEDATVHIVAQRAHIAGARRTPGGHVESVNWKSPTLPPASGVEASYEDEEVGLKVDIVIEEVMTKEPEPAAFVDPDVEDGT